MMNGRFARQMTNEERQTTFVTRHLPPRFYGGSSLVTFLIVLGLFLLPLALLWQQTLGGKTLIPADALFGFQPWQSAAAQLGVSYPQNHLVADLVLENYAWKRFIVESLSRGESPLWNPYTFAGEPFLANGQHSALYPFSLIFYVLRAPLPQAYGWFTVSQLWLVGVWMYLFARVLGLRRASAVIAAVTYQLSAFFVFSIVFTMIIAAAAWLPFILAMTELVIRQQPALGGRPARAPWVVLGALGLGMAMLAGHPEMIYPYTLFVVGIFALWRLAHRAAARSTLYTLRSTVMWLAVMVGLGLALGAVQFLPMLEALLLNFREGSASLREVLSWSYPWRRLIAFLIPNFFGNESHHAYLDVFSWQTLPAKVYSDGQYVWWGIKQSVEGAAYLGILPLVLAMLGIFTAKTQSPDRDKPTPRESNKGFAFLASWRFILDWLRHPYVPFFTLLALFSLALVFPTGLYALIYKLPGLGQLHTPFRWVFPYTLSMAVLAGFGADFLARTRRDIAGQDDTQSVSHERRIKLIAWALFWAGLALIVLLLLSRFAFPDLTLRLADAAVARLAKADTTFANGRMFYSYLFPWLLIFGLMVMASGIVVRVSRCPIYIPFRRRPIWELLAVAVIALDLFAYGYGFNPAVDPKLLDYRPPVLDFLKQDASLWRFTTYDPRGLKTMNANSGWWNGLQDVRGYDSMFPKQYLRYIQTIEKQDDYLYNRVGPVRDARSLDSPMLDLLNVKYVITEDEIPNTKFTLVYNHEVKVYRNEAVAPRAFTLPQSCTVYADDELAALGKYDPRQYVVVSGTRDQGLGNATCALPTPLKGALGAGGLRLRPATVTVYKSNEVWIDVQVDAPAWLVLGDSYFPGWVAYARPWSTGEEQEKELSITRADGNFRAVQLEPGAWTVRFKYSPLSWKLGAFTTFIAAMVLVLLMAVYVWRYAYRESAQDSPVRRVAKNSFTAIALNLMTKALDMAFAMLMARLLGPEGVGRYYFAVVIYAWFDVFTSFGLQTLLTREVARDRAQGNRYLLNTALLRVGLGLVGLPVLVGFLMVFQSVSPNKLAPDTLAAIALLYVGMLPISLATGLTGLFYAYEKAEYPAAITVVTVLIKIAIGVPVLVLTRSIVGIAAVSIVVNTITLGILAVLATRMFFKPRWESDRALQRSMLRESFPLMINNLLSALFFKVDVTLLQPLKGEKVVGWYNQAYKWVDALNVIPAYFTFALFPVLSRQAVEDKDAARRSYHLAIKLLVMLALPMAVLTTFFARELTTIITFGDPRFQPDSTIALQLMIWSIPFGWINSVTNYVLIALGQQRKLTNAFLIGLGFNVIANLIFIPLYSYQAAAVITILSEIVEGSAFYWYIRKSIGPVPWAGLLWRVAGAGAAMFAAMFALCRISAPLGLFAGLVVYPGVLLALGAFGPEERAALAPILPRRLRKA
jgi:O-antigen/teichoic acid export membrane protein